MDRTISLFCLFVLLASAAYATDINATLRTISASSPDHFGTSMRLTTGFNLSVASGNVASGNPASLQPGDTICSGAVLSVTPTVSSTWALSGVDIVSPYPACGQVVSNGTVSTYCPVPPAAGATNANVGIKWLDPVLYASYYDNSAHTYYFNWNLPSTQTAYSDLGPFYDQRMSYDNGTVTMTNKEGGTSIICTGNLSVGDNGVATGSSAMPAPAAINVTIATPGTHAITTSLAGTSCFGAVVTYPISQADHQTFFRLYMFPRNQPSMPSTTGLATTTLNVLANGGNCTMHTTAVSVSRSAAANGTVMVETTIHNDADPIQVLNVTSSDPAFVAVPFPVSLGSILGFGALSPASNGFNTTINSGADQDLYVLITTSATSGGTVLTFDAETLSAACGASGRCNVVVDLSSPNPVTCGILPPALTVLPLEIGQFNVACQDLAGAPVSCVGSNWVSSPVLRGTFLVADNTQAQIYSQATPPASGLVTYTSSDDIATCNANLNVVSTIPGNTTYSCAFMPPSANMSLNEAKYFVLNCLVNGTIPTKPDDANYSMINGLIGSTSNGSVNGVTYTAPAVNTNGDLRGAALLNVRPNVIGAVALALINININSTPYNCSILPASTSLGTQTAGLFTVTCTNNVGTAIPCIGNAWAWSGISGGFIAAETDNAHTWAYPTSAPGATGLLTYTSGMAVCNSTVTVVPANFSCVFSPSSATMKANGTRYFATQAYDLRSGTPVSMNATSVIYDLINGLGGSHSNDSVAGTQYNAPDYNTSGQLQGAAVVNTGMPSVIGPVCLAPITVGGSGGSNDGGTNGRSQWCTIYGSSSLYPGYIGWFSLWCGPNANETCISAMWTSPNTRGVQVISWSNMGAYINVTAASGESGSITAIVNGDSKQSCTLTFTSGSSNCADLS